MTNIFENISLKTYNTFGIDVETKKICNYSNKTDIDSLLKKDLIKSNKLLILGGGSNYLFTDDFNGLIIHPVNKSINIVNEDNNNIYIKADAGVVWDNFVEYSVNKGYGGIENLSGIPGSIGAAPVQNIGAYGVEVKNCIFKVHLVSLADASETELINKECEFGYRTSIFKTKLKNRYIVDAVTFKLSKKPEFITHYGSISEELKNHNKEINLKTIRETILKIRDSKLPNPAITGNGGSFFKNPVVNSSIADNLLKKYPDMPVYNITNNKKKLAAGWLIEQCGLKGFSNKKGTAGVHHKQALVLINKGNASGKDILEVANIVKQRVADKFKIDLEPEVIIV
jgi:UDP-N-acetylmuramate dehydrogenase